MRCADIIAGMVGRYVPKDTELALSAIAAVRTAETMNLHIMKKGVKNNDDDHK